MAPTQIHTESLMGEGGRFGSKVTWAWSWPLTPSGAKFKNWSVYSSTPHTSLWREQRHCFITAPFDVSGDHWKMHLPRLSEV